MQTYKQFAEKHNVTLEAAPGGKRTETTNGRKYTQDKWNCTLLVNGLGYDFPFYMGEGLGGKAPTIDSVFYCLASDAQGAEESFEDWCFNLGYDDDSRKAYATYEACEETARELERLFGTEILHELYYETNEDGDE